MSLFENVEIHTERLKLRCFINTDKEDFYSILQDPVLYKTLPNDHMYNREEVNEIIDWFLEKYKENTIENIEKFTLAIILKEENRIIGDIGIGKYSKDETKTEFFYFINSRYWNRGIVSEAARVFLEYIQINELAKELIADVVIGNTASCRILEKNGFVIKEKEASNVFIRVFT